VDTNQRRKIIILSILLHILLLLLWEGIIKLDIFEFNTVPEVPVEEAPIVFDLQQPQRPTQVIETPDDAKQVEVQDKAKFLSDKNALARNQESDPKLKIDEAHSKGDFNSHDLPVNTGPIGKPQPQELQQQEKEQKKKEEKGETKEEHEIDPENLLLEDSGTAFLREYVLKRPNPNNPGVTEQLPSVTHDNRQSRAEETGGLSFNTYNWNFAPYMLMLKRKIQRNIFPPAAFSQLGMIQGETLLRFRIYPDGRMTNLEVLNYKGHKSLMDTSHKAITISAPFPELPKDFPEPYLEITGKFIYFVRR
jgi:outer membrane biosynthesis protein TonB